MSVSVTRDGLPSVAGRMAADDARNSTANAVTMADVIAWAENNKMKPTGNTAKDLAAVNRMRAMLRLPAFTLLPDRAVPDEPLPPPHEIDPSDAPPKRGPYTMTVMRQPTKQREEPVVEIVEPAVKPIERNMRGLVDALFDELDEIRAGRGSEARVKQITQVSVRITELMGVEMKYRKMALEADGNEQKRLKQIAGMKEIEG